MKSGNKYRIIAIVEGYGEVEAVPIMLTNWFKHRRFHNFETSRSRGPRASGISPLSL